MSAAKEHEAETQSALRRTWRQRSALVAVFAVSLLSFVAAAGLGSAQWVASQRQLVELDAPTEIEVLPPNGNVVTPDRADGDGDDTSGGEPADDVLLLVEPDAANFLVVGADSRACGEELDRTTEELDEGRSDTIMLWRVNPQTNALAVLSFPRDLYVDRPGGYRTKINAAYRRNDPSELVDTLYLNFGVPVDHYVQVDFCAFQALVEAVDGVAIPLDAPVRDRKSELDIPHSGCINLDGVTALAYVRSRRLQVYDAEADRWRTDPTGDLGRISRQQDFVRRLIAKVIDQGLYSPRSAGGLIDANRKYLVTDAELTVKSMLEFASTLRDVNAQDIDSYQIESYSDTVSGASIQRVSIGGENMQAILRVFRGEALMSDAPVQEFEQRPERTGADATPTTVTNAVATDSGDGATQASSSPTTVATAPTTLPTVFAEQETIGVIPLDDSECD